MESETLRKIDEALHRLEEGTYGVCEECGEKIGEARLKALPFAGTCRDCQKRREEVETDRPQPRSVYEEEPAPSPRRSVSR